MREWFHRPGEGRPRRRVVRAIGALASSGLVAVAAMLPVPATAASAEYRVQQITGIAGSVPFGGVWTNDAGQVAGTSPVAGGVTPGHALLWTAAAGAQDLGTLGGPTSAATGINGPGHVAGVADIDSSGTSHAFLWASGAMRDLGVLPGGTRSAASDVNDLDQVVGRSSGANFFNHAFIWTAAQGMIDLGTLPGDDTSEAQSINAAGQVVGESFVLGPVGTVPHGFIWSPSTGMQPLTPPAGFLVNAVYDINSAGQVVGQYSAQDGTPRPFLYSGGTWTDLGTLPGDDQGFATGINDSGLVVGVSTNQLFPSGTSHAVRWTTAGGAVDLNSLIPPAPAITLTAVNNVTNQGLIAATAGFSLGTAPFYLLTPVTGQLRVTTNPALPSQILVDGTPADSWGLNWMDIAPGSHTISFTHVEGFSEPGAQQVTVTAGATTTVEGGFTQRGSLRVTTSPAVPAAISVDGSPRDDWGLWTDLPVGSHQVCFGPTSDFTPPGCQTVSVTAGSLTQVTGSYTSSPGAPGPAGTGQLRVTTSPALPSQVLLDGVPMDSWGLNWVDLAPGTHTLSFTHVEGYTEPAPQTVVVTSGSITAVQGSFTQRGSLRVLTSPAEPASIAVDGVPRNNWGMWTDLPVGSHTVCFGAVPGTLVPPCQAVTLHAGVLTTITGTYTGT